MKTKVSSLSFGRGTRMLLLSLFLLILIALEAYGATLGQQLWVRRYNGPGNDVDEATAIALDSGGNVYVTGSSFGSGTGSDYATIKYDPAGNKKWVKRYNGPANRLDRATAITLDSSGNIYVTGWSGSGTGYVYDDYATIKYDPAGNLKWVKRYNGPGNDDDQAHAIAVDSSGNVYVTGQSTGSGTGYDYATIKYDSAGNVKWVKRYNGPGNDEDGANAIAVDSSGNVYVTGKSTGSGTSYDYATIKYDSAGNVKWVRRYKGSGNLWDEATAIVLDTSGNVYVTGSSIGSGTGSDYATIKYDSAGKVKWVRRYNGPANGQDGAEAIAIDSSSNVYVTGWSIGSGTGYDYTTIKYDSAGNVKWVKRYNGPGNDSDYAYAMALDSSGNVYITGLSTGSGTGYDYTTIKYDSAGNVKWVKRYNGPGNDVDGAEAIAIDSSGKVYVTGKSTGSGTGRDYATIKYAP